METSMEMWVYRRLDNRLEGLDDQSERGLELHRRRAEALHAVFKEDAEIRVRDWGGTDDARSHEVVGLVLSLAGSAVFRYAVVPGVEWLGKKLAEKAVDTVLGEAVKALVARLRPKQAGKQVLDFSITLPDATQIVVDPPDRDATITIRFKDGAVESLVYGKQADGV